MKNPFRVVEDTFDTFFQPIIPYLKDAWLYIKALKINIFGILLIGFVFLVPAQSIDLFNGLIADNPFPIFWFLLSVTVLSLVMWYSGLQSLILYDLSALGEAIPFNKAIRGILFLTYMSVFIICCIGFSRAAITSNYTGAFYLGFGLISYPFFLWIRERVFKRKKLAPIEDMAVSLNRLIAKDPTTWKRLSSVDQKINNISIFLFAIVFAFALLISFFDIKPVAIPQFFNTAVMLCIYLALLQLFLIMVWGHIGFKYLKIGLLLLVPIFSMFNNNHQIRLVDQKETIVSDMKSDFSEWLYNNLDTTRYNEQNKFPIFLIAAEGGGIRSAKWTALTLNQLFEAHPRFKNHTYAISGVSGGSVGAVFQQASMERNPDSCRQKLNAAISKDFLSPVTFGLLFPDLVQSFVPFPIDAWDRSRWLEDAWYKTHQANFNSDIMNQSVNDYWNLTDQDLPNIFLNTTSLETGQKAIISNLKLAPAYFENVIDLSMEIDALENTKKGIPLKTAASLSSRFPLVTSAGKVDFKEQSMNIVDGGYHDNTGLETLLQLVNLIVDNTTSTTLAKCQLSVLLIKNSLDAELKSIKRKDFLVDLNTATSAILSNWNNKPRTNVAIMKQLFSSFETLGLSSNFYTLQLDRDVYVNKEGKRIYDESGKKVTLPLGWYLSDSSNKEISRQASALTDTSKFDPKKDEVGLHNYQVFETLIQQIR